jgi:hypothetical protein
MVSGLHHRKRSFPVKQFQQLIFEPKWHLIYAGKHLVIVNASPKPNSGKQEWWISAIDFEQTTLLHKDLLVFQLAYT